MKNISPMNATSVILISSFIFITLCLAQQSPSPSPSASNITCTDVNHNAGPCMKYAKGQDASVPPICCDGMRAISAKATSLEDKKAVCLCLKKVLKMVIGLDDGKLQSIPATCNVQVPFKLEADPKCDSIK